MLMWQLEALDIPVLWILIILAPIASVATPCCIVSRVLHVALGILVVVAAWGFVEDGHLVYCQAASLTKGVLAADEDSQVSHSWDGGHEKGRCKDMLHGRSCDGEYVCSRKDGIIPTVGKRDVLAVSTQY